MSTYHQVTLKPISDVAKFMKNLIPTNIPEIYALNPVFDNIASEERIRAGVIAYRDFLYLFFDRLILDGHLYAKPPNKPSSMTDYPFLDGTANLLTEMGFPKNYIEAVKDQTMRTLWSLNNVIDSIPDTYWDREYCEEPAWKHVYHTAHYLLTCDL